MLKKRVSVMLVCFLLFILSAPVYAYDSKTSSSGHPLTMIGILKDDQGNQFEIEGVLVSVTETSSPARMYGAGTGYSATYMYNLPTPRDSGGSNTVYDNDGAIASTVYLTIDYLSRSNDNVVSYLLTEVSGHWVVTNSSTTVTSASIDYCCDGIPPGLQPAVYGVPVENYFSVETGFEYYIEAVPSSLIGAHLHVNYRMGSSRTWSFTLSNLLYQDVNVG